MARNRSLKRKPVAAKPQEVDLELVQAISLHRAGKVVEAEAAYDRILKRHPDEVHALHMLGVIFHGRGESVRATELISKSLKIDDTDGAAWSNYGVALAATGAIDEAIAAHRRAVALQPENPNSRNNLAITLLARNAVEDAISVYREVIALKPDFTFAYFNLAIALQKQGRIDEALSVLQKAVEVSPNFAEAYCNMGLLYMATGRPAEAIAAYKKAIEIRPDFPEALNNLGQPLSEERKYEEAAEAYRGALRARPGYRDAVVNLAYTLRRMGKLEEAIEVCSEGIKANPDFTRAIVEIANLRRHICDWSNFAEDERNIKNLKTEVEPFVLLSTTASAAEQLECAKSWASKLPRGVPFVHGAPCRSGKLRIGYLSNDYRRHATAYLMAELFERHDRSRFEVVAYSYGYDDGSDVRRRLEKSFDRFVDISLVPDEIAARQIHADGIDVLVDLKGYTSGARTRILVDRPAPIQVNYVGYPGTMGADFIDYIIADNVVAPSDHAACFSEKIVQLPFCYQPNDTKREISQRPMNRALFGLPQDAFVFASFNGVYKISPVVFEVWMRLLKAVPGSVLWLLSTQGAVEKNLRREAAARGVAPERLIFCEGLELSQHLARHRLADLFLDTLPINAHTTSSDALWAGLPVVTCLGDSFVGRVAASTLRAVGLPQLIALNLEDYETKALHLATNPEKLAAIRQHLVQNGPRLPLFNIGLYTQWLERAYVHMVELRKHGHEPQGFAVTAS